MNNRLIGTAKKADLVVLSASHWLIFNSCMRLAVTSTVVKIFIKKWKIFTEINFYFFAVLLKLPTYDIVYNTFMIDCIGLFNNTLNTKFNFKILNVFNMFKDTDLD